VTFAVGEKALRAKQTTAGLRLCRCLFGAGSPEFAKAHKPANQSILTYETISEFWFAK
jgi:hypothetical protein